MDYIGLQLIVETGEKAESYIPQFHRTCRMDPDYSVKQGYPTLELSVVFLPKATNKIIINKTSITITSCVCVYILI